MTRSCELFFARSRRMSAVRSEDWSFTAMISTISGCAASDAMQAAMEASSLRAGTMAVTWVQVFID